MRFRSRYRRVFHVSAICVAALALSFTLVSGCGQTVLVGLDDARGGNDPIGGGETGGASGVGGLALGGRGPTPQAGDAATDGGGPACIATLCRGKYYQCGDCVDNEGDGSIDALDPECLGPCDDDETGLSSGVKMSGGAPCHQDCYFDGDAGPGNDQCEWSQQCDPLSVAPDYPPSGEERCAYGEQTSGKDVDCAALGESQPQSCLEECLPLVPNGCDCFGCCELPSRSGEYHFIGKGRGAEGCELGKLDDLSACPRCTPVPSCLNDCAPCEVCVGSGPDASCQSPRGCEGGRAACDSTTTCATGEYCVTGCCVPAPPPR